jgi:hypothetical protein
MNVRTFEALEVCLAAMQTGVGLDACLGLYPELAEVLRPVLEASLAVQGAVPAHGPDSALAPAQAHSRRLFLVQAARWRLREGLAAAIHPVARFALALTAVLLVVTVGWSGLTVASAQALPGDLMYSVKRAQENIELSLAPSSAARQSLWESLTAMRASEVRELIRTGRPQRVNFRGLVETQEQGIWRIAGVPVVVQSETLTSDPIRVGDLVEVNGETLLQGLLRAEEIRLRQYRVQGQVEAIAPLQWTIAGLPVAVDDSTRIDDGIALGTSVLAIIDSEDDRGDIARLILNLSIPEQRQDGQEGTGENDGIDSSGGAQGPNDAGAAPGDDLDATLDFTGTLESSSGSVWVVDGYQVVVLDQTELRGDLLPGIVVRVRAVRSAGGDLLALRIEAENDGGLGEASSPGTQSPNQPATSTPSPKSGTSGSSGGSGSSTQEAKPKETDFHGQVESRSGSTWIIGGRTVRTNSGTELRGDPLVGDPVRVRALLQSDGTYLALRIEVDD